LRVDADDLRVDLANRLDGTPRRPGRGLRGMTERVAALGGDLTAGPDDGEWRVRARVPLTAGATASEVVAR
jgi:signal transduction histidine kinase